MREIGTALIAILTESAPFLILGFALAGVIHVVLQRFPGITARLGGPGRRPVFMASLLGAPMPLCSCSVLPAALALRRQGASKGTTAAFLISVPETDIVSILITLALIGPFVAVYRPLAAVAGALATGFVIRALENRERNRASSAVPAPAADACACEEPDTHASSSAQRPWWSRALRYGFVEIFDDVIPQLLLGIVIAAVIGVVLPDINPRLFRDHTVLSYLVMLAVGIPVYVCASASTPIAAGLIAGGVSPGAAMVFLLAGPATNIGSLLVLRGEFGARALVAYVVMIAATSVALGALMDAITGSMQIRVGSIAHEQTFVPLWGTIAMLVLLAWTATSFHRSRLLPRMGRGISRIWTTRTTER